MENGVAERWPSAFETRGGNLSAIQSLRFFK